MKNRPLHTYPRAAASRICRLFIPNSVASRLATRGGSSSKSLKDEPARNAVHEHNIHYFPVKHRLRATSSDVWKQFFTDKCRDAAPGYDDQGTLRGCVQEIFRLVFPYRLLDETFLPVPLRNQITSLHEEVMRPTPSSDEVAAMEASAGSVYRQLRESLANSVPR
jgi:hypothetical protein